MGVYSRSLRSINTRYARHLYTYSHGGSRSLRSIITRYARHLYIYSHGGSRSLRSLNTRYTRHLSPLLFCCSKRRRRFAPRASPLLAQKSGNEDDFSLEDLPDGHSNISKKHLSSVGDDCFTCLRGWVETGGQVAIVKMEEDAYSELGEIHRNASGR